MALDTALLWGYAAVASLVLGASVYETLVVHPAWSRKPPESFEAFVGAPIGRMNIPAFWIPVAPLYALSGLGAAAAAYVAKGPTVPLLTSAACAVGGVTWTVLYFRPTIERFLMTGSSTSPTASLTPAVRRWIVFNWCRVGLVAVSWWGVMATVARRP